MTRSVASPSTSRQARGRSHPPGETGEPTAGGGTALDDGPRPAPAPVPSIVLELDPDPVKGARVWVYHQPQEPARNAPGSDGRGQRRLDLSHFAPIEEPAAQS